jgi:hypothetical protein
LASYRRLYASVDQNNSTPRAVNVKLRRSSLGGCGEGNLRDAAKAERRISPEAIGFAGGTDQHSGRRKASPPLTNGSYRIISIKADF